MVNSNVVNLNIVNPNMVNAQYGKPHYGKPQYGKFTLFEQFYTIQTIISLFFKLCCFICFPYFIYLMLLVILMTINILYSNYKQTYYFTIIRYFTLHLIESTSIFIIFKTAYSISSALEHI